MKVAVIGGGAAGFFASISVKEHFPNAELTLFEKSSKTLSKVKVSGGGRCNVTHDCRNPRVLSQHYPRGERFLRDAFRAFAVDDTIQWFENQGVELKAEADGRMFPVSDRSQTIIDALHSAAENSGVQLRLNAPVLRFSRVETGFELLVVDQQITFDYVIVATGGSPKMSGLTWLEDLGQPITAPVPSLFTFNLPTAEICALQGVSVPDAVVWLEGEKWRSQGPLLITHWGLSGPAVLKASAIAARALFETGYSGRVHINWVGGLNEQGLYDASSELLLSQKKMANVSVMGLPMRLWHFLLQRAEVNGDHSWQACSKKTLNRLWEVLTNDVYSMDGKTTFKEEFVTAGGVSLSGVHAKSMESKHIPGLYFAGEVLDIDGFTGGFNFQAAWTTAWIAGRLT